MRRTDIKKPPNPEREYEENKYEKPDSKREYESRMGKWGFWAKTAKWSV